MKFGVVVLFFSFLLLAGALFAAVSPANSVAYCSLQAMLPWYMKTTYSYSFAAAVCSGHSSTAMLRPGRISNLVSEIGMGDLGELLLDLVCEEGCVAVNELEYCKLQSQKKDVNARPASNALRDSVTQDPRILGVPCRCQPRSCRGSKVYFQHELVN